MRAFMTTGTVQFLESIAEKNQDKTFQFMKRAGKALIYYEDDKKKSIFVSGTSGDIELSINEFNEKGFVVMMHVPVREEEAVSFKNKMNTSLTEIKGYPGLRAIRLINEDKSNKYIIMMQWSKEKDYQYWEKENTNPVFNFSESAKLPAYFADRPFTNSYYMIENEED